MKWKTSKERRQRTSIKCCEPLATTAHFIINMYPNRIGKVCVSSYSCEMLSKEKYERPTS